MAEVNWTLQSLDDINNIAEFISRDSEKFAGIQVRRFFESSEIRISHPRAGRIVPEINKTNIRELIVGSYRLIYKIVSINRIDVLTVHHSKRKLRNSPAMESL